MSNELMPEEEQPPLAYLTALNTDPEQTGALVQHYRALLSMVELFARQHSLPELLVESGKRLQEVASFDLLSFVLHDAANSMMRLTVIHGDTEPASLEVPIANSDAGQTWENQYPIVISELTKEQRYPETIKPLCDEGMNSACILPMTVPTRRLGAIVLASSKPSAYARADLTLLQQAAGLTAMSIDNTLSHQSLSQDKNRVELLLQISRSLSSSLHFEEIFPEISEALRRVMAMEYASISVPDKQRQGMNLFLIHPSLNEKTENTFSSSADSITAPAMKEGVAKCYNEAALEQSHSTLARRLLDQGMRHACCFPLITPRGAVGTLTVACKHEAPCDSSEMGLMMQISNYIAIALENAQAYDEIAALKNKLAEEKLYLEDEIRSELNFEEIIGDSPQLKRVLADAKTVAPSAANVLILGETGTGKELIARAIHKMSGRKDNSFIKLNCAAIPTGLLESELFGHERGAFTGAITQKIGRMELANGGTLFLDEVGDIPPELQPKLLRVLQDQEFERLGSTRTIKVNVRLIAATNRDLAALVAAREFRSDLYYRLKVFPIQLPPLRDRRADIPLLVRYFVQRLSRRMNKAIDSIPTATMDTLTNWDWPGNIRELENFMERSVILSTGPILTIPATELRPLTENTSRRDTSLETADREHILRILRETGGVISGIRGAAARLGLKRTTLQSKMQKLGISRMDYQG
jgi:formate hydrogenlyase transcriptional activator